ncbi:3-hydroxy-2-methylbutyryl-CoA dehydrogenase [Rhodococcus rhodochrous KG-21]|uniref:3-hydroxy-2-methylbutyryl-CoA dehydrogenase n=2 Tax=Rhodococcus rhodochrous TaxID=1829 RepID=A0A0M9WQW9_RHORH|nr:SDR family NAD(P)-dependent oxidoreductase [Rhodococcus rhodochrous]KOS58241.1 3-hydroxy-2-methylbutyryl-CoA dehydrogenase [Rhodococcus rhodochrous KG-21]
MHLQGRSALVVGGTSGVGEATAERLVAEGCTVVITGRDVVKGRAAAQRIGAVFCRADVRDVDAMIAAVDTAADLGAMGVLVHCAGVGHAARTIGRDCAYSSAHSLDDFRETIDINLVGTFNAVRLAASAIARTDPDELGQRGAIVLTSSLAAMVGQTGQAAYAASKAGQLGLLLPLARDLSSKGIRVNAVVPGGMDTAIYGPEGPSEALRRAVSDAAIFPKRMGRPAEFASLVVELLRNDYINASAVELAAGTVQLPR